MVVFCIFFRRNQRFDKIGKSVFIYLLIINVFQLFLSLEMVVKDFQCKYIHKNICIYLKSIYSPVKCCLDVTREVPQGIHIPITYKFELFKYKLCNILPFKSLIIFRKSLFFTISIHFLQKYCDVEFHFEN